MTEAAGRQEPSPSQLIDDKIEALGDWRGATWPASAT